MKKPTLHRLVIYIFSLLLAVAGGIAAVFNPGWGFAVCVFLFGFRNDASNLNYENAFSRTIPAGEYTVNLHMYFNRANVWPIKVKVLVSTIKPSGNSRVSRQILVSDVVLRKQGEERTVFRFKLDDKGELIASSVNAAPKNLRTDAPGGYNFGAYSYK